MVRPPLTIVLAVWAGFMAGPAGAQTTQFTVVSGASYGPTIAPDSWGVILGTGLSQSTATAVLNSDGQWPGTLAGISVQVNGQTAALYYVSPKQINFLVPDSTTFGAVPVVIGNTNGGSLTGNADLENTAAAIFSSDSSGTGPGAILNAVTNLPAPFLVVTPQNGGSDPRTRLAVYATGLRWAGNLSHDPTLTNVATSVFALAGDQAGNNYQLAVEYAGPAPGYFGLDQVNLVLPAEMDGAGVVSVELTADSSLSNTVTFAVNSLPASSLQVAGVTLSSSFVAGGGSVTATVEMNGVARSSGFPTTLKSSLPTAQMPAAVTIATGQASGQFQITTLQVAAVQNATITAQGGGAMATAALEIDPVNAVELAGFTVTPAKVQAGQNFSGVVTLTGALTSGSLNVQISSNNTAVQPPTVVAVAPGSSSATFSIPTAPTSGVTTPQTATLTATSGHNSATATVTVVPAFQFTLSSGTVTAGSSVTGTVTQGQNAPAGGATITLSSSSAAVEAPFSVSIPAGQTSASFTINTTSVTAPVTATITANDLAAGLKQAVSLIVSPASLPQLTSLTLSATSVSGGLPVTGTIRISGPAPAGGLTAVLSSSGSLWASVPQSLTVTVPQGLTAASFNISTTHPPTAQTVTITAKAGGISETATLIVQ